MSATGQDDVPSVDGLRRTLLSTLDRHVPPGSRVVLVDFPLHLNAGDSAIYLGQLAWLADRGIELAHACSLTTYDPAVVRRELRDGILLFTGGGNFGDLWPYWHALRERLAGDFPDRRIVQLPQTLHYSGEASREAAGRAPLGRHEALTLLTRDRPSTGTARAVFPRATVELAPDMAFALGPQARRPPSTEVLWLGRDDMERQAAPVAAGPGLVVTDWRLPRHEEALWRALWLVPKSANRLRGMPAVHRALGRASEPLFGVLARIALEGALRTLSEGRVVVTDRLHGHIITLLLGIPQVAMDNRFGKVSGFMDAWTGAVPGVHRAASSEEALRLARELAALSPPGGPAAVGR